MREIVLRIEPVKAGDIRKILKEHGIFVNRYAEEYFAHPCFISDRSEEITVTIASLREIGFENGAQIDDIFRRIPKLGLKACLPCTGLFLRSSWTDQPQSRNSILSGTHDSPDQAVMVLSEIIEQNDDFPKGLYLRNVDGSLWLRGYICDMSYRFSGDALFAFEKIREG